MTATRRPAPAHARSTPKVSRATAGRNAAAKRAAATRRAAPAKRASSTGRTLPTTSGRPPVSRGSAAPALALRVAPDAAPRREEPRHLEVVRRPPRRRLDPTTRARLYVGAGAMVAVTVAFALVFLHVDMAQRQFRLDSLNAQVADAQTNYSRLRLQVAQLEAPQQIIATAEGKLGMRQPSSVTYLTPSSPLPPGASADGGTTGGTTAGGNAPAGTSAPAGDADWPQVKSQLAGSP